jgi:hypothetical protein
MKLEKFHGNIQSLSKKDKIFFESVCASLLEIKKAGYHMGYVLFICSKREDDENHMVFAGEKCTYKDFFEIFVQDIFFVFSHTDDEFSDAKLNRFLGIADKINSKNEVPVAAE